MVMASAAEEALLSVRLRENLLLVVYAYGGQVAVHGGGGCAGAGIHHDRIRIIGRVKSIARWYCDAAIS